MNYELRGDIEPRTPIPPVLITGLSGAGLSSAARVLEDMGWYVIQNLPPHYVLEFVEQNASNEDDNILAARKDEHCFRTPASAAATARRVRYACRRCRRGRAPL